MSTVESSLSEGPARLTEEQKEFILRQIAAFLPQKEIVSRFWGEFPDCQITEQELNNRIRYIARDKKTDKWRQRIEEYREELRQRPINSFAIGNQFDRIRIIQKLIDTASEPNLRRIVWYPERRDPDGTIHYASREVWEPNYHAALRGIAMIHRELKRAE